MKSLFKSRILIFLTVNAAIATLPSFCLPVLFAEIAADMDLDLVQVGGIWAATSLTGMFIGLLGGAVGDRLGSRTTLAGALMLTGLLGAARGLTDDFSGFLAVSFLVGLVEPAIPINLNKVTRECFDSQHLGSANAFLSMGFGIGLLTSSLISAAWLSPLLGGWRNVLFFYGFVCVLSSLVWIFKDPMKATIQKRGATPKVAILKGFRHVTRIRALWVIALGAFGVRACIFSVYGYLPTYLKNIGWPGPLADTALAVFIGSGVVAALPAAALSDRFQARRQMLMLCALTMAAGVCILGLTKEPLLIWLGILLAGMTLDAFMSIYNTSVVEIKGVGASHAGVALGFTGLIRNLGAVLAPPLGNALAVHNPSMPFLPWAGVALLSLIPFHFLGVVQQADQADNPAEAA